MEEEGELKEANTSKVLSFPTPPADAEQQALARYSTLIARILKLSESDNLHSLVREYAQHPHLSLEGEAYSAREWIDDRQRNRKGSRMTPAFFRRWLKRECEMLRNQERQRLHQATGTGGGTTDSSGASVSSAVSKHYPNLNGLSQRRQAHTSKPNEETGA